MDEYPEYAAEPGWHWRNCRQLSVAIFLNIWPWQFGAQREDGVYGGWMAVGLGPIASRLDYGIGNVSAENRFVSATGLSEAEAYERACRYEGARS